ncbi:hypothetical protein NDU88_002886 [Pleurodeles waltl]|uniref:Uncharacterized protein n=1 Tax=Pleurodeles waltl TaxID=8319 RepID=A0AAV7T458_PLEWA|nr:hypothetical protein NDU88_002886 [Pleurodeles waltl]
MLIMGPLPGNTKSDAVMSLNFGWARPGEGVIGKDKPGGRSEKEKVNAKYTGIQNVMEKMVTLNQEGKKTAERNIVAKRHTLTVTLSKNSEYVVHSEGRNALKGNLSPQRAGRSQSKNKSNRVQAAAREDTSSLQVLRIGSGR